MHYRPGADPKLLGDCHGSGPRSRIQALTDRYQTTVPETVRRALKLGKRDKIHYTIRPGGEVLLKRAQAPHEEDPVLGQFLDFLTAEISHHPERLQAVDAGRLQSLVGGVDVDLDAALSADDE
ncbi:type II toxin-antitoxin system PrlF family antitoxin [Acidithiobacillus sp. HP-6]|nr:type II toxin-antitoxin system PrlF family antitoxin [Acidithiobacillus sp. HP-6]MBE7568061.1 type II toxin-antitoxin system PrlF family antitoxin [Acidithiobacillus sp. HP-2]